MEDSELGVVGRPSGQLPLEPVLTNTAYVFAACPSELRLVLDRWLAQHAWRAAAMQLSCGNRENAALLLNSFPLIQMILF